MFGKCIIFFIFVNALNFQVSGKTINPKRIMQISNKIYITRYDNEDVLESKLSMKELHKVCRFGYHLTKSGKCRLNLQSPPDYFASEDSKMDSMYSDVPRSQKPCENGSRRMNSGGCRKLIQAAPIDDDYDFATNAY